MVFEAQKPVMSGTCAWKLSEWKYPKLAIVCQSKRKVAEMISFSKMPQHMHKKFEIDKSNRD